MLFVAGGELLLSFVIAYGAGGEDTEIDADDGAEEGGDAVIFVNDINYELREQAGAEDSDEREDSAFIHSAHHSGFGFVIAEDVIFAVRFCGVLSEITISCVGLDILPAAVGEYLKIFGAGVVYCGVIVKAVDHVGGLAFFKVVSAKPGNLYETPAILMHIAKICFFFFVVHN